MKPILLALLLIAPLAAEPLVMPLWQGDPPGPAHPTEGEERDLTKPDDRLIAGRRIIKLGHVRTPEMHVFLAPEASRNGTTVVVAPGGGFSILAWDLEGLEVAEWLNSIGVSAVVLKYRVPTRTLDDERTIPPIQDIQRAISLTRERAGEWKLDPQRVGTLGFSAGGYTAGAAALAAERLYAPRDAADERPFRPDFSILIYTGGLFEDDGTAKPGLEVADETPPMFLVHAIDDRVPYRNSTRIVDALHAREIPVELHLFDSGGHGFGLRPVENQPCTRWPELCRAWMRRHGWLEAKP